MWPSMLRLVLTSYLMTSPCLKIGQNFYSHIFVNIWARASIKDSNVGHALDYLCSLLNFRWHFCGKISPWPPNFISFANFEIIKLGVYMYQIYLFKLINIGVDIVDIKNNAWVTVNNDFFITTEVICQWFSQVTKSQWKSLANHLTSDQKIVIHGNECIILFLTRYFMTLTHCDLISVDL